MERRTRAGLIFCLALTSALLILPVSAASQEASSPIFIVYGTMYKYGTSDPMDLPFTIMVENTRTGLANYAELGASGEVGTFSVVLIDYSSSDAVRVDDTIVIRARRIDEPAFSWYALHVIEEKDVLSKMKQIDFAVTAANQSSWGAIKQVFKEHR
jgi:hypothetical protein